MPIFKTRDDIEKSLRLSGLLTHADDIVDSALSCLVFTRRLAQDGKKNMMESRMGGLPAVPDGFEWPSKPAVKGAKKLAKQIDASTEMASQPLENPFDDNVYAEMAKLMSAEEVAKFKAEMDEVLAAQKPPSPEVIAQMKKAAEAEKAALFETFPMSFVGQINLGQLSPLDGFDEVLPRAGMLSMFKDVRSWDGDITVFHFQDKRLPLSQMAPPTELEDHFDAINHFNDSPWNERTKCEVLSAQQAFSVPYHWGMPKFGDDLYEWLHEAEFQFSPGDKNARKETYFGDQLGGYPEIVQDLPEFDLMPKLKPKDVQPGKLPWRMVFSYGNEHFGETRQMASSGDGQSYLMMHIDDLARHDFGKVQELYQQT